MRWDASVRASVNNLGRAPGEGEGWLALSQSQLLTTGPSQSEYGMLGAVRTRPLAARWPTPSPRASWSRAGSQSEGFWAPCEQVGSALPPQLISVQALSLTGVGACRGRILTRGVFLSRDSVPMVGDRVRPLP